MPTKVAGRSYSVATKPGVFAYGHVDTSTSMLASEAVVEPGGVVVHLNCGGGLAGVAAASGNAQRVYLTDRNVVNAEAARRTIEANGIANAEVLLGHGTIPLPPDLRADTVTIRIPKEKVALRQLLRDAFDVLRVDGRCYVAGPTNEGIKSAARLVAELFGDANAVAHESGHRVLFARKRSEVALVDDTAGAEFLGHDDFNRIEATLRGEPTVLFTRPSVFSWDHVDEATSILADAIDVRPGESVLDLGCGAGPLGIVAARLSGTGKITLVDADMEAVRSTKKSAAAAGIHNCRVLPSDVAGAVLGEQFDVVVTNPPFHVGKATDLDVPLQFIRDAFDVLSPGGRLFLVANRTLPYERPIYQRFGNIVTVVDGRRFKVLSATRS
ncbi:MAG TPA: class I SAM-dependent methyltransferase [Gemmatimonadaceae bacterium]